MLLNKQSFPEENELVLCTVTGVNPHSVFATLDEYGKRTGLIHISEVSPGRIRNIRDYVKEDKKVVCKVLRVDPDKGHIDLSLRRVNESQKRQKLNEIKQEQLAEKIIEQVAKQFKQDINKFYPQLAETIMKQYDSLYPAFEAVALEGVSLEKLGVEKKTAKELTEIIMQRIKPPEIQITGYFLLSTFDPKGVDVIKKAIAEGEKVKGEIKLVYSGAGKYHLTITAADFKTAEKQLKQVKESVVGYMQKKGSAEFVRHEAD